MACGICPAPTVTLEECNPATRAQIAADDAPIALFTAGDDGLAAPEMGETLLAVRRRLTVAAERRGWVLDFVPTGSEALVFQVRVAEGAA